MPFLHHAMGSANELEHQLGIARDLGLGHRHELDVAVAELDRLKAMLARLIVAVKRKG